MVFFDEIIFLKQAYFNGTIFDSHLTFEDSTIFEKDVSFSKSSFK
jgi:hypothetical protein